jgi:hypothetical protein
VVALPLSRNHLFDFGRGGRGVRRLGNERSGMTTVDISALAPGVATEAVGISIHITTTLNVSAQAARQKVNGLVLDEVGTGVGGEEPALVVEQTRALGRVPLVLSLPFVGRLGQVGTLDVDAQTGEVLTNSKILKGIADYAERLAINSGCLDPRYPVAVSFRDSHQARPDAWPQKRSTSASRGRPTARTRLGERVSEQPCEESLARQATELAVPEIPRPARNTCGAVLP